MHADPSSPAPSAPPLWFDDAPGPARAVGLRPFDPGDWLVIDAAYEAEMALRDRLIGAQPDAVTALRPEGVAPLAEFWALLAAHLADRHGDRFLRQRGAIRRPDGVTVMETGRLGALGRLVQEDWALLAADGAGAYRLVAAVACFPSRWRLSEKIGRPLTAIHAPVSGYAEALAPRVDRVFAGLRAAAPLERVNWTAHRSPALHQPVSAPDAGGWWLRTERQTLRRLPETGAVAFGIKTRVTAVSRLDAAQRERLASAVRALSPAEAADKGFAVADLLSDLAAPSVA